MARNTRNRYFLVSYSVQLEGSSIVSFGDISTISKGMLQPKDLSEHLSGLIPSAIKGSIMIMSFTEFKNKVDFDSFRGG